MEQGDKLEKRRLSASASAYGLDGNYDADATRPAKFFRMATMKMVCASVAVVGAVACGVVLLALPQSGPAAAVKDAYHAGEKAVRSAVFRGRTSAQQREIEDVAERTAQDNTEDEAHSTTNPDSARTLNMLTPLTDYNTAHSIEEGGIYIPPSSSDHFANIWDEFLPNDAPLYWDGQLGAGYAVSGILGRCYDMTVATTKTEMENLQSMTMVGVS